MDTLRTLAMAGVFVMAVSPICEADTAMRAVSGLGCQASAHGLASGLMTDVLVAFNDPSTEGEDNKQSTVATGAVFITQTDPNTGQTVFQGSGLMNILSHHVSRDLSSATLSAVATVIAFVNSENSPQVNVSLNLTWAARSGSENVKGHDSFSQPNYEMTQNLAGALRRTTVSGNILVGSSSIPIAQDATPAFWSTTNNRTTQTGSAKPSGDTAGASQAAAPGPSCIQYWFGFWTWDGVRWFWTWVWYACGSQAWIAS